jgi:hypothetical protein
MWAGLRLVEGQFVETPADRWDRLARLPLSFTALS